MSISGENEKNSNIYWSCHVILAFKYTFDHFVLQAQSYPFPALFFLYFLCCIILNPESSIWSPRHRVVPSLYPVYVSTNFSTVGE